MLPIHSGAISGVTNELQDRTNYHAAVQEIRASGDLRVNMVARTAANDLAGDVKRNNIDPDQKDDGSGNNGAISYDAIANEVAEEEQMRQDRGEHELASQKEELKHNPPLGVGFTAPSVIVSSGEPNRAVAKFFIKAATIEGLSGFSTESAPTYSAVKVDVTV